MEFEINLAPNLVTSLLSWYDINGRDLPWREHPDPWSVLVSEIMLQQTTVPAVIPYFQRWMQIFPSVENLAMASMDEVLVQWEGLGYYNRARNLHAAAQEVLREYNGAIPSDPRELKKLPGLGEYTAAAVASIAYGIRMPALDANNLRVWSRLLASQDRKKIIKVFTRVLPSDRPGEFNQALMDLGSVVCTPKTPQCVVCPLSHWCRAYRTGRVSEFPKPKIRARAIHIEAAIGIILEENRILVQKRPEEGLMAGLWEFPGGKIGKAAGLRDKETGRRGEGISGHGDTETGRRGEGTSGHGDTETGRRGEKARFETPEETVIREVWEETGLRVQVCEKLGVFSHSYTRFRVRLHVFICRRKAGRLHNASARWVTLGELEGLAMPSVNRRIVRKFEDLLSTRGKLKLGKG